MHESGVCVCVCTCRQCLGQTLPCLSGLGVCACSTGLHQKPTRNPQATGKRRNKKTSTVAVTTRTVVTSLTSCGGQSQPCPPLRSGPSPWLGRSRPALGMSWRPGPGGRREEVGRGRQSIQCSGGLAHLQPPDHAQPRCGGVLGSDSADTCPWGGGASGTRTALDFPPREARPAHSNSLTMLRGCGDAQRRTRSSPCMPPALLQQGLSPLCSGLPCQERAWWLGKALKPLYPSPGLPGVLAQFQRGA